MLSLLALVWSPPTSEKNTWFPATLKTALHHLTLAIALAAWLVFTVLIHDDPHLHWIQCLYHFLIWSPPAAIHSVHTISNELQKPRKRKQDQIYVRHFFNKKNL